MMKRVTEAAVSLMKTIYSILLAGAVAMLGLYLMGRAPQYRQLNHSPWALQVEDGQVRVFDVQLGHTSLLQATAELGEPEKVMVFVDADGSRHAEAFFGKVEARGITGRLIARLRMPENLSLEGIHKQPGREGSWKYEMGHWQGGPLADSPVDGLSFLPDARGIPAEVLAQRFGVQPVVHEDADGNRIFWFEPLRLRILMNERGRMVLEYGVDPADALPQEQLDTGGQTG